MQLAGASGAAALAGCTGSNTDSENTDATEATDESGGGSTDTSDDGGVTVHDVTLEAVNDSTTKDLQWNYLNSSSYAAWPEFITFDDTVQYDFATDEFVPYGISDWTIEGKTVELQIREDLVWADGDPITAQDLKTQFVLAKTINATLWDYVDSIETTGEKSLELNLKKASNQTIVEHALFTARFQIKHEGKYKEWYETIQSEGVDAVKEEITSWAPSEPPVVSGPFKFKKQDSKSVLLERNPEHPDADNINFKQYRFQASTGNQQKWQGLVSGKYDAVMSLFTPPKIVANLPDKVNEARVPAFWGWGLMPNHEHEHVGKRKVRQAIMHAIDREKVKENAGPRTKQAADRAVPIAPSRQEDWLGDEFDTYRAYNDPKAGEQLMREAGYSKKGGTWRDDNGDPVRLPLTVMGGWSDWVTAARTAVDQLNDFGFESELVSKPGGTIFGDTIPNGDFVLQSFWWLPGGARSSFPYFVIRHQLGANWGGTNIGNYPAYPDGEVTVPSRTGSGETTVNPMEQVSKLSVTQDEATVEQIVRKLAWALNVDLPMLPMTTKLEQSFVTEDEWDVPEDGSEKYKVKWPSMWLPRTGELQYEG